MFAMVEEMRQIKMTKEELFKLKGLSKNCVFTGRRITGSRPSPLCFYWWNLGGSEEGKLGYRQSNKHIDFY
jgi:hypothetical protein